MSSLNVIFRCILLGALLGVLTACSPILSNQGYMPPEDALEQIVVGIDTRTSVEETIGSPGASGATRNGSYYYIRSRLRTTLFFAPEVVEREVLAISFDSSDVVANVERFGLEDGRVVRLQARVTESGLTDKTFLRQLLGNLGRIGPT